VKFRLGKREREQLAYLTRVCNEADGTGYSEALDADLYFLSYSGKRLVSFLAAYRLGGTRHKKDVMELVMLTDPAFRGRGRMRRLLQKFRQLPEAGEAAERYSVYPSKVSNSFLEHAGAVHEHDECVLQLKLGQDEINTTDSISTAGRAIADSTCVAEKKTLISTAAAEKKIRESADERDISNKDSDIVSNRETDIFWNIEPLEDGLREITVSNGFSRCGVQLQGRRAVLHSVRTDRNHLRQGSAEAMLRALIGRLKAEDLVDSMILVVSSANKAAVALYKKLGFQEIERLEIWYSE